MGYFEGVGPDPQLRSRSGFGAFHRFQNIFEQTIELILDSAGFVHPTESTFGPWVYDPEFWHFIPRRLRFRPHRSFVRQFLYPPKSYDPAALWALFWGLVKAEHQFLVRYIPFWSHEERLTGHLIAEMITRIEEFTRHWSVLSPGSELAIWYADTAAHRRESNTGADLGLIIHSRFADRNEFFKVARFQAKKVGPGGSARIDFSQVEALLQRQDLGHYLFYHAGNSEGWQLGPTVMPAASFKDALTRHREDIKSSTRKELGTDSIAARDAGCDLATFITFALADPVSQHGVLAQDEAEAVRILMAGQANLGSPSRVLAITLGAPLGAAPVNWRGAFSEYLGGRD